MKSKIEDDVRENQSGVEAIANATSVMKLDPGSTEERPSVSKTATPAITWVVMEVTLFTALLGLGMHALGGLEVDHGEVNAPGHPGVRDQIALPSDHSHL